MPHSFSKLVSALERLQAESTARCLWRPPADVYRTSQGWLVKLDLAGVNPQEIQLVLEGRSLTIAGVRLDALVQEGMSSYSMEISYNRFERTIELPMDAAPEDARLEYREGMLLVWIQEKPRQSQPEASARP
jgi:HSP20 family protein